ncbi:MAG TPA: tetratricopeptide repeat protein [Pyrinomonadaceae bacterium]|nr:tetratricopeptide repeat protein [Pyrinomonadaceae bacterium]
MRVLSLSTVFLLFLALSSLNSRVLAQKAALAQNAAADVVMVLPFENTSNRAEYNWVGESFADALVELLNKPGLIVVSSDERDLAYQSLRLPETVIPSRATAIKLARQARATMIVIGSYSVTPPATATAKDSKNNNQEKTPADAYVQVTARVIKVNEGRTLGEVLDGGWATRQFDYGGPLTELQDIHGRLAYQILYQRDKALPYSQNQIVQEATKIPQKAFEAYVKAVQLNLRAELRANYLKNALHYYAEALGGAVYPQAAFELGRGYMSLGNWKEATEYFSKLQKKEPHYAEAAFYASLGYTKLGDYGRALATVVPLSSDLPLIGVYNNAGAVAVQAARENKNEAERTRLLNQATEFLKSAAESAPNDPMVHFNYGYALFLSGKYADAAEQFRPVITADQRDGQAYFLFAKSLSKIGKTEAAAAADDQARRYLQSAYAKWETEWQKSQTTSGVTLRLRDVLNREEVFNLDRGKRLTAEVNSPSSATQDLLIKARDLYQAGRDEEALPELHRVVMIEPTNAEAYLLSGRINLRRSDQEAAIAALKTAIFWDPKLIDAHILLGKIFLERGDRGEARKYAQSAITIDPNNQEAIALQRQVTMGN